MERYNSSLAQLLPFIFSGQGWSKVSYLWSYTCSEILHLLSGFNLPAPTPNFNSTEEKISACELNPRNVWQPGKITGWIQFFIRQPWQGHLSFGHIQGLMGIDFQWHSDGVQEETWYWPSPMTRDTVSTDRHSVLYFYFAINRISSVLEKDSAKSQGPRGEGNIINPFIKDIIGFLWVTIRGMWLQLEYIEEDAEWCRQPGTKHSANFYLWIKMPQCNYWNLIIRQPENSGICFKM